MNAQNTLETDEFARWARGFLRALLDHWLAASATETGLFHPYLDRQWQRNAAEPRTLVSQCRLIYNFSRGYELFEDARYAEAAQKGLAALQNYFSLPSGSGYRWAVTERGAEAAATPDSYGHAFCILAQATAARAFGDLALAASARDTWRYTRATFRDSQGGFVWRLTGPNPWTQSPRSQNPMMHTFEALMALHTVDQTGEALAAAREVLAFVGALQEFTAGRLIEQHTPDWKPQPAERGGVLDLGHAFEWAWLLSEWHAITQEPSALETGIAFLSTGLKWGLDTDGGGIHTSCDSNGRLVSPNKGLWQQCEAIRAISRYAKAHGKPELSAALKQTLQFYQDHFIDPEYGGLFSSIDSTGKAAKTDKGDPWKLDYHTVSMCLELLDTNRFETAAVVTL